jgi:hypothetical protein
MDKWKSITKIGLKWGFFVGIVAGAIEYFTDSMMESLITLSFTWIILMFFAIREQKISFGYSYTYGAVIAVIFGISIAVFISIIDYTKCVQQGVFDKTNLDFSNNLDMRLYERRMDCNPLNIFPPSAVIFSLSSIVISSLLIFIQKRISK